MKEYNSKCLSEVYPQFYSFLFYFLVQQKKHHRTFVFILVDDLGWADVKCNYPENFYDTPNID
ncbi:MAG: hypothetical protein HN778_19670 [Prolixibacteraceae bacterium]|nr:hypothetical protein [Prolixibacteraceae bacterium]MBT6004773.1 hypothetical protein [Prolixibacteraceae bacterium]MBT6764035.1 hypothetical protein [Prolixibacteraceae bacterium]MBT6998186.1 hypothetical protein [Prolixibacteraceae bacterium]MBT7397057.1 hypothetical protein [Prolixibacteraceae bacterium]